MSSSGSAGHEAQAERILSLRSNDPERRQMYAKFMRMGIRETDAENTPPEVLQAFTSGAANKHAREWFARWLRDGQTFKHIGMAPLSEAPVAFSEQN